VKLPWLAPILALIFAPSASAQPDVNALIRQSVDNYDRAWRAGTQWGYTQQDITSSDGRKEIATSEVIPLYGTPYERLLSRNGMPLSPEDRRKEEEKFARAARRRAQESPAERLLRIQKYEKERAFVSEIAEAYNFKIVGNENVGDRPAWVVSLAPRSAFVPSTPHAELLKHIEGKLWIDKRDLQWARAEAHVIDTISIGVILARIAPGAYITLEMGSIAPGLWMPRGITIDGDARVLLVHNRNLDERLTFSGYRLEQADAAAQVTAQKPVVAKAFR
jgi:hypothetical protein